jgi:hypothetical protein
MSELILRCLIVSRGTLKRGPALVGDAAGREVYRRTRNSRSSCGESRKLFVALELMVIEGLGLVRRPAGCCST